MLTTMLELTISMAFFYLMFSSICSAVQELIANAFRWRAKTLELGLVRLLQDPELVKRLYEHPVIKGLSSPRWIDKKNFHKPSYIPAGDFASALMDVLKISTPNGLLTFGDNVSPNEQTKKLLGALMQGAGTEAADIRKQLENWFDAGMDRVGGWYKRTAHAWLWAIGIVVCIVLNADSVNVAKLLWNDEAIRASTVEFAKGYVKDNKQSSDKDKDGSLNSLKDIRSKLSSINMPLGWCGKCRDGKLVCWPFPESPATTAPPTTAAPDSKDNLSNARDSTEDPRVVPIGAAWITKLFGILLTVLAVSQGAPFWFDLLNKVVNLRLAGESPAEAKQK